MAESDQMGVALHVMFGPRLCYAYEGTFQSMGFTDANGRLYENDDQLFENVTQVLGTEKAQELRKTRLLRNQTLTRSQLAALCE